MARCTSPWRRYTTLIPWHALIRLKGFWTVSAIRRPSSARASPSGERAAFGVAEAQPGPGGRRDDDIGAKAFSEQIPLEGRDIPLQTLDGPRIVSRVVIGPTQDEMRPGLEADMPERGGQGQSPLAVDDGAVHLARHPAIGAQVGVDPPEPQGIAQRLGQGLGAAQVVEHPLRGCAQDIECDA